MEYLLVRLVFALPTLMSFRARNRLLLAIMRFVYRMSAEVRDRIGNNLAHAFPDRDDNWRRQLAYENLEYLARMMAEFLQYPRVDAHFFKQWFGFEKGPAAFADQLNQGGILILGHLGSWEWKGIAITHTCKAPLYVFAKRQSNPWANAYVARMRSSQNIKLIYTDESPRKAMKLIKEGALVAFIADQDAGPGATFYDFCNRPAATYHGPAMFARLTGAPLHFVWSHHDEHGRLILGHRPFDAPAQQKGRDGADWEREFTRAWVDLLEEKVYQYPADYYWLHNRWIARPGPDSIVVPKKN
ncbi:MAG: lysophospholipid acyltransferase family protein [Leptospiraceae bacterium]|nr:lysophospholipid acyltransferase family protein [Leptospiraceae bacterium]